MRNQSSCLEAYFKKNQIIVGSYEEEIWNHEVNSYVICVEMIQVTCSKWRQFGFNCWQEKMKRNDICEDLKLTQIKIWFFFFIWSWFEVRWQVTSPTPAKCHGNRYFPPFVCPQGLGLPRCRLVASFPSYKKAGPCGSDKVDRPVHRNKWSMAAQKFVSAIFNSFIFISMLINKTIVLM